LTLPLDPLLLE